MQQIFSRQDRDMSMFGGFEGSDLASVYGNVGGGGYDSGMAPPAPAMQSMGDVNQRQPPQAAPAAASHAMPPDVAYNPPAAMYAQGQAASAPMYAYGPSYWDRLASKRGEVFKLIAFSLVFLLGLSIHHMAKSYLKSYIADAFLTPIQEVLVRLSYPIIIILVLWLMKTSS